MADETISILLSVGTVVVLRAFGIVMFDTKLPLTITVIIIVLFGPGLNPMKNHGDNRIHEGQADILPYCIYSKGTIGIVWKESTNIDKSLIIIRIISPWKNDCDRSRS